MTIKRVLTGQAMSAILAVWMSPVCGDTIAPSPFVSEVVNEQRVSLRKNVLSYHSRSNSGVIAAMITPSLAQQHLKVSQLHYDPIANPDAQFIELFNESFIETIDLTGVKFVEGVDFDFTGSSVTSLGPFQRVLVVKDAAAFESVFGTRLGLFFPFNIAGEFANGTSLDSGGETIKLEDASGETISHFSYDDEAPWPNKPGHSIIFDLGYGFSTPPLDPDPNNPADWFLSGSIEGSPMGGGALFRSWLAARGQSDPLAKGGDGWSELATYGLGRDIAGENFVYKVTYEIYSEEGGEGVSVDVVDLDSDDDFYVMMEFTIRESKDVTVEIQTSTDMLNWVKATNVLTLYEDILGDGTMVGKYRVGGPIRADQKVFTRVNIRE